MSRMRICCPHCHAIYHVDDLPVGDVLFVCHRCGTEFSVPQDQRREKATTSGIEGNEGVPLLPLEENHGNDSSRQEAREEKAMADVTLQPDLEDPEASVALQPPVMRKPRLWRWLSAVLLVLAASGFWLHKDAWVNNPWLRSMGLNLGLPVAVRGSDWSIEPDSVQAQWLIRDDGSRVMVIQGTVANRLASDLRPPSIEIVFYAASDPQKPVQRRTMAITLPPSMQRILHAPFSMPPQDTTPVSAHGKRGFLLVVENLPEGIGDFSLQPVVPD